MEVASMTQPDPTNGAHLTSIAMDASMDIDMDIDLGPLPEPESIEIEPATTTVTTQDGLVDPTTAEAQYEKVHIRGVDDLTTDNIKQFATDYFSGETPSRIEWIDDTSANIIYSSPEVGLQALAAFTQASEEEDTSSFPPLRLRSAKALSTHPESVLQVRSAVKTDRKKPRAYEASRFYLMHPEHDPREKLRRELAERRRQGGQGSSDGDYQRRRFDGRELRRRRDRDADDNFSANMYDDEGPRASTDYSDSERGRNGRTRRGQRELFPDEGRLSGRLRNRSASPGRDTLAESGRLEQEERGTRSRFRERSPQLIRRNEGKELFPSRTSDSDSNARELFPNKPASSYLKKELFPSKQSNHRRSDAIDAADETADLFSRRISVPRADGARDQNSSRNKNIELFPDSEDQTGVSIRGAAGQDQGISIRGAANGMSIKGRGSSVRELFPSKYNSNAGKELFSDKIEGRGGPRRRAEDMFG
ncbi:hypothetical protein KXW98_004736 [Aspergillus fumigatus]|uniref:Uncharacterized protein n=3 Tax=Aspergillus fumigatus TaxID=746128 RepID=Q4WKA7_ASPFU|nr:conserved hypothetical protein [Aspergillus fumigatus Af293]EDP55657.1 conserved hypothetical protein [Aspergillus fumigatus A1163]KAF4254674.1 hypothetical protein CNMCM8714_004900 [Aspergillus fumigatus]KMK57415.1 hypothetical protein Y699_06956 [Aspergillus fumigatus Z5]EAL88025.1 conserved hypothetical protein [Aspergillus fumigatus Af293]KAF4264406.1 hypothetical protein CNMCM8812_003579 [Aspergillus fumigatus]